VTLGVINTRDHTVERGEYAVEAVKTPAPETVSDVAIIPEPPVAEPDTELVEEDLLVEDVSIDGMCGVY
jgi:mycofactocin precursor